MGDYRRLLSWVGPHRGLLALAVASMAVLAAATGLFSWLVGPLFQFVFDAGRGEQAGSTGLGRALRWLVPAATGRDALLGALPWLILGLAAVRGAAYFGQFYAMGMLGQRVVADLRLALQRKLLALPPPFFARSATGDLVSRFATDVAAVEFAVTYGLAAWLRDGLQVVVLLGVCVALDWRLSLLGFVAVPLTVLPIVRFARRLKGIAGRGAEQQGLLAALLHEGLSGVRVVQAFGMEAYEAGRFAAAQEAYLATMRRSFFVRAIFTPTLELMAAAGIAATVVGAAHAVAQGSLEPERVISFLATLVLLYTPLKSLGAIGQGVTQGLAGARRLFEVLDEPDGPPERPGALPAPAFARELRFERVSFAYPARGGAEAAAVLREVDLTLRRGEVVALVGASGGGKSTLLSLVPRFADPTGGRVTLDGHDLRDLDLASLRAQIALVSQETFLFDDTVRANVAYGRPGVPQERLDEVAQAALALDFIRALPQGWETRLGERGVTLSGGQRQRLAIARALLKDAPILLLDEATSALDSDSERLVQAALERLMERRTCLVIAHRLSTIRHATRIAVLEGGRVVEEGPHEALLARAGPYARLHALQAAPPAPLLT